MRWLKSLCALSFLLTISSACAQTALVQIIHNSADTSMASVDVWYNHQRVYENLNFHYATPYLTLASSDTAVWEVRLAGDTTQYPPLLAWSDTLLPSSKHILILNGIHDSVNYHPYVPLRFDHREQAIDLGASTSGIDITFCHGITDIDSIDISET